MHGAERFSYDDDVLRLRLALVCCGKHRLLRREGRRSRKSAEAVE